MGSEQVAATVWITVAGRSRNFFKDAEVVRCSQVTDGGIARISEVATKQQRGRSLYEICRGGEASLLQFLTSYYNSQLPTAILAVLQFPQSHCCLRNYYRTVR